MYLAFVVILSLFTSSVFSFYLPGMAPVNFCREDAISKTCPANITLYVNRLNSDQSVLPYEYHHFDFCIGNEKESSVLNLGQVLFGADIRPSPYKISFLNEKRCSGLCKKSYQNRPEDQQRLKMLQKGMMLNYQHHWIIDNMPVTFCHLNVQGMHVCTTGFPMGCYVTADGTQKAACLFDGHRYVERNTYYVFNHVDLIVSYRDMSESRSFMDPATGDTSKPSPGMVGRIIRVEVLPRSIQHESETEVDCSPSAPPMAIPADLTNNLDIVYSYSIRFQKTSQQWSSRWDYILDSMPHSNMRWFSIQISVLIVLFLSCMMAMMLRTLQKDISTCNQLDNTEDASEEHEEVGWKLVHGDVFRPPRGGMLLSVFVGSGSQILCMMDITLFLACLGLLTPASRGSFLTCALVLYMFFGIIAGYISAQIYKTFGGLRWRANVLLTSFLCPGIVFGVFFVSNAILWTKGSSAAIPVWALVALLAMWLCISIPLTFVGSYFGFKKRAIEMPVRTNQIPREVPDQSLCTHPLPGVVMGGILPFGCIFLQLFFILNCPWAHHTYYMFGFMFLVSIILMITCSDATVLLCYFHLCAEDYHWWWRSFLTSGFTAFYAFLYCIYYFMAKLSVSDFISTVLYFSYTLIMIFVFFLLTGTIGFFACLWFTRKIYSSIKVDQFN